MTEGNSITVFGDLSKPLTVLIQKISNATGILYEPRKIIKKAEAEAKAKEIKLLSDLKLTAIQQRGVRSMIYREERRQKNIEDITSKAINLIDKNSKVGNIDEDWIAYLFKNCDTVSDKEMQSLWANLLAGEAVKPGRFSKKTINVVASMDKKDAESFTKFCQFSCFDRGENIYVPLIWELEKEIYTKKGVNFMMLKHLDSIGLISFDSKGYWSTKLKKKESVSYFDKIIDIEFNKEKDNHLSLGYAIFTQVGVELASICGAEKNDEFYLYIIDKWRKEKVILSTPII